MFNHQDLFTSFDDAGSLKEKLVRLHRILRAEMPFIARLAIALYDPKTEKLATYLHSSGTDNPLPNYQAGLEEAPSLQEILRQGKPRVVNNLVTFANGEHAHTLRIGEAGYAASYTRPMYHHGLFFGFQFFNSFETDVFSESNLHKLDIYG